MLAKTIKKWNGTFVLGAVTKHEHWVVLMEQGTFSVYKGGPYSLYFIVNHFTPEISFFPLQLNCCFSVVSAQKMN